jgi:carbon storage regulator
MLVLKRKVNEGIIVGDNITLRIIDAGNGFVRIGIEAPPDVRVLREELYEQISSENEEASQSEAMGMLQAAQLMRNRDSKEHVARKTE